MTKTLPNNWPTKRLRDIIFIHYGKGLSKSDKNDNGKYQAYGSNGPAYKSNKFLIDYPTIIIGRKGSSGDLQLIKEYSWPIDTTFYVELRNKQDVLLDFLYYLLLTKNLKKLSIITAVPGINRDTLYNRKISLPPLPVQQAIVTRLDAIRDAQELNNKQISLTEELFQSILAYELNPKGKRWEVKKLGDLYEITSSKRVFQSEWKSSGVPFYRAREIVVLARQGFVDNELFISEEMYNQYSVKYGVPKEGDIMITGVGTLGICYVVRNDNKFYFKDGNIIWLKRKSNVNSQYVGYAFKSAFLRKQIDNSVGATVGTYTIVKAKNTKIPLPPFPVQQAIVEKLQSVQDYKSKLTEQKAKLAELFASTLSRAMNGELVKETVTVKEVILNWFGLKQGIGAVIDSLANKSYERGEMVIAKFMYLLQEVKEVPFGLTFARHHFGPYDPNIKKAILASAFNKDKFFKVKGAGDKQVYSLGDNSNTLFGYNSNILNQTKSALDDLMPDLAKAKSEDIERLASVCKVIQDKKSTDVKVVQKEMSDWKGTKFTPEQIAKSLTFVTSKNWHLALLKP